MNARSAALVWTIAVVNCLVVCTHGAADQGDDQYAVAAAHYTARRWDLATTEFQLLLERFPQHVHVGDATFFLGESLLQLHRYRDAAERFGRLAEDHPQHPHARLALYRRGESLYLADDVPAAEPTLRKFLARFPGDPLAPYAAAYLGNALLLKGEPAAADNFFQQALKQLPQGALAESCQLGRGRVAESLGQMDEAARQYQQLVSSAAPVVANEARMRLGTLQYRSAKYDAAVETLTPLAADSTARPLQDEARLRAGQAMLALKRLDEAAAKFEKIDAYGKWADEALWGQIQIALAKDQWEKGQQLTLKFEKTFPQSPLRRNVTEGTVHWLLEKQRYGAAVDHLRQLSREAGGQQAASRNQYLLAVAYAGERRFDDALAQLDGVATSTDKDIKARALASRGAILLTMDRYAEATEPLLAYLAQRPEGANAVACRRQLAVCYARTGKLAEARQIDAELQVNHADDAGRPEITLALGEAALAADDVKWAKKLFERIVTDKKFTKSMIQAISGLARCQLAEGDFDGSIRTIEGLLAFRANDPAAATVALNHSDALVKKGRTDDALKISLLIIKQCSNTSSAAGAMLKAAELYEKRSQPAKAQELYERLIRQDAPAAKKDANNAAEVALYRSAWLLKNEGRTADAIDRFRTLHDNYPSSRFRADAAYRLAESALSAKRYDEARGLAAEIRVSDEPGDLLAHACLLDSRRAVAEHKWAEAEVAIGQLLSVSPSSKLRATAEYWRAEIAYRAEKYDEAGERFDELARRTGADREPWRAMVQLRRGQLAAQRSNWSTAKKLAAEVQQKWPKFHEQYEVDYLLGRCFASEANFDEARKYYRRVTASEVGGKSETAAMAQWMIGESLLFQQQYDAALREYLRVEALYAYPRWQAAAVLQAGKCYESLGRWTDAAKLYDRVLKSYGQTMFRDEAQQRLVVVQKRIKRT